MLPYQSGIFFMGDAFSDLFMQWTIDEIFARAAPHFFTVPTYGIISTGVNANNYDGGTSPTAIMVRRAHRRPKGGYELPLSRSEREMVKFEIEMLLRSYGITTSNFVTRITVKRKGRDVKVFYGNKPVNYKQEWLDDLSDFFRRNPGVDILEGINVQIARESGFQPSFAQLVDFGHYNVVNRFKHPVASLVRDRLATFGAALGPQNPAYVQPNPRLAVNFEKWGRLLSPEEVPQGLDGPSESAFGLMYCHSLARDYVTGRRSGWEVRQELRTLVEEVVAHWEG